jgi:hypothetical protein
MYTQSRKQKATLALKAIRLAYKARKLTNEQRRFLESGLQELL